MKTVKLIATTLLIVYACLLTGCAKLPNDGAHPEDRHVCS